MSVGRSREWPTISLPHELLEEDFSPEREDLRDSPVIVIETFVLALNRSRI